MNDWFMRCFPRGKFSKEELWVSLTQYCTVCFYPPPSSHTSEWFASGGNSQILLDLDNSSVMEDGRKKLNTVFHYKVNTLCHVCMHLQWHTSSSFVLPYFCCFHGWLGLKG